MRSPFWLITHIIYSQFNHSSSNSDKTPIDEEHTEAFD